MDWMTTYDNVKARSFYDRLGSKANEDKVFYRLDADGLMNIAKQKERSEFWLEFTVGTSQKSTLLSVNDHGTDDSYEARSARSGFRVILASQLRT